MDHVDRAAARVSLCAASGFLGGAAYATYAGFPVRSVSLKASSSCAIVGTVMFGTERLAYVAMQDQMQGERRKILTSHAFSGVAGGALNGYLYQKKPLRGMFLFIPAMMVVGSLELWWESAKAARMEQVLNEAKAESNPANN